MTENLRQPGAVTHLKAYPNDCEVQLDLHYQLGVTRQQRYKKKKKKKKKKKRGSCLKPDISMLIIGH